MESNRYKNTCSYRQISRFLGIKRDREQAAGIRSPEAALRLCRGKNRRVGTGDIPRPLGRRLRCRPTVDLRTGVRPQGDAHSLPAQYRKTGDTQRRLGGAD